MTVSYKRPVWLPNTEYDVVFTGKNQNNKLKLLIFIGNFFVEGGELSLVRTILLD